MMRLLFIIISLSLSLCACHHKLLPTITNTVKDSVIVEKEMVVKDTVIVTKSDSVTLHDSIKCPELIYHKEVKSNSGKLVAFVDINKGILNVGCKADSLQILVQTLRRELIRTANFSAKNTTVEVPVEVIKYKVPTWCWWLLVAIALYFGCKYFLPPIINRL